MVLSAAILTTNLVQAHSDNQYSHRADSHAPIGVTADHFHKQGEWMFSARKMKMSMENETTDFSSLVAASNVALEMSSNVSMIGGMYGWSDDLTFMMSMNYQDKEMDILSFNPGQDFNDMTRFSTSTEGFGDLKLGGAYRLSESDNSRLHTTIMLSVPTASIDETGSVTMPNGMQMDMLLPNMMQLGSGTYDSMLALTYSAFKPSSSWGVQWKNTLRYGENDRDYSLPNQNQATAWYAYSFNDGMSTSLRGQYLNRNGLDTRWDVGMGLNYKRAGHRLAAEYLIPVSHDTNMVLEAQDYWVIGYQYSF